MKALSVILLLFTLTGCVTASYTSNGETFRLTTFGKSAEGVSAERGDFTLSLNKTESQVKELLELAKLFGLLAPVPVK